MRLSSSSVIPQENHFCEGFVKGAEWMAEKAQEWLSDNMDNYNGGEVDLNALLCDFQRAMAALTDE